ncbi:ubiquitin-like domain-containing protein [Virgibacillus xinjiangensis]|uniref:Ubiquitin-like domain-containing protein n=1 Tax=Virgibacillus xinjiangensis TaxID=393090 RepID=A0ABV7CXJ3_9BACI
MRLVQKLMPASKWKLVISSIGVIALMVFAGMVLYEATKAEVTITDNGRQQTVSTHQDTVEELLKEVGIEVGEYDEVSHQLEASIENGMKISYITAKNITVTIDGNKEQFYTTASTVEKFFADNGLEFGKWDEVSHNGQDLTEDGLNIEVTQAYPVTLEDGGKETEIWTTGGSVKDFLNEHQVKINKHDRVTPSTDERVTKGTTVSIVRVKKETTEINEPISFETETKYDDSLAKGKEKVLTEGRKGEILKKFEVTYENGEEVSRELIDKEVIDESVDRLVAVGTKEPQTETGGGLVTLADEKSNTTANRSSSNAGADKQNKESSPATSKNQTSGKTYTMTASAYTAACDGCSGYTATGIDLKSNPNKKVVAVDPSVIPLGTKVWVEGYGEAIASDTGGHIVGNRIDIHMSDKSKAYGWGKRTVQVKVLN